MENNCIKKAYAVKNNDLETRLNSSSGGVFSLCASYILEKGGAVYGADFDKDMNLYHKRATKISDIARMRGAKYIKSDISSALKQITEDLNADIPILFTGTPCQISAVKKIAQKYKSNQLYTLDLICHGTPSTKVWNDYIKFIEKYYNKKVCFFKFRDKEKAWREYKTKTYFADGTTIGHNNITGSFIELFRYDVCINPACTKCRFANTERVGDITIGDFWGIENVHPELDDNKGVSAIIVNTQKGEFLFDKISNNCTHKECSIESIIINQPNLQRPSQPSNKAKAFSKDYKTLSFDKVLKKYTRVGLKRRIIDFAKKMLIK